MFFILTFLTFKVARILQNRLALATVKAQNGWANLTLDAIEPKIDEDLKRKRARSSEKSPAPDTFFNGNSDLEWLRQNRGPVSAGIERPRSQASDSVGPLPSFPRTARKRTRNPAEYSTSAESAVKRQRARKDGTSRQIQSSPGYYDEENQQHSTTENTNTNRRYEPTFHSSPPRTPPRRMLKSTRPGKNTGEEGADLLLYLATSPSPATAAMPKHRFIPTTPPSTSSALPSSMMHTPGAPQTPHGGFDISQFINITPSPFTAPAHAGRGTPIANARRRLDFDHLAASRSPVSTKTPLRPAGIGMELGGELVS